MVTNDNENKDNSDLSRKNSDFLEQIKKRKREGIEILLTKNVQGKESSTFLEYVRFLHNALPEIDFDEIDTSVNFLGRHFSAPLIIDSMTRGTDEAFVINKRLGQVAERYGLGMGLGSQRAGLKSEKLVDSYAIARKVAPNAFLIANIGGAQLAEGLSNHE